MSPYHLHKNKKKLARAAFESPPDEDEVSVSRGEYVPKWLAKAYAKVFVQILNVKPRKEYKGLAFIATSSIRSVGSNVVDSRKQYLGHADIQHGFVRRRGETLEPKKLKAYNDKLDKLVDASEYIEDISPNHLLWKSKN